MSRYKAPSPEDVLPLLDATRWNYPFASRSWVPVKVDPTFDYSMLPSDRPLYAILTDVVQHGVDNPKHGTDCACLDKYIYELRAHVVRALPEIQRVQVEEWKLTPEDDDDADGWREVPESRKARMNAIFRISHVLRCIKRHL
jgi:hypothetical protein